MMRKIGERGPPADRLGAHFPDFRIIVACRVSGNTLFATIVAFAQKRRRSGRKLALAILRSGFAAPIEARAERPELIPKMRRLLACAFAGAVLSLVAASCAPAAAASEMWIFCVASARGGADVWITDVFAATRDREKLERDVKAYLARQGATRVDAQCPAPVADKTEAINAQFDAVAFNRKLGAQLHEVPAREFELTR